MARKDVDLVIRAKDEAEKVISAITKALNGFNDAQRGVQDGGKGTQDSLAALGSAIANLDRQVKGANFGQQLTEDMNKSVAAIVRLETEMKKATVEVNEATRALERNGAVNTIHQQKLAGATAAQTKQTEAVAKAKVESKALADAQKQAADAVATLTAKQAKLPEQIAKQELVAQKAAVRFEQLAAAMRDTTTPSDTLVRNFTSSGNATRAASDKLAGLRTELATVEGQLRAAGSAQTIFGTQADLAAQALLREEGVLGKITTNLNNHKVVAGSTAAVQARLKGNLDKATDSLARQGQQLDRAEDQYIDLAQAAGKFDAAVSRSQSVSKGNLEQQLTGQALAAGNAGKEFAKLSETSSRYAQAATSMGPPTREASRTMQFLAQRADEAHLKLMLQQDAAKQMGLTLKDMNGDLLSSTNAQARFIAEQDRLAAALRQVANDGLKERMAIRDAHTETDRAAASAANLANAKVRETAETRKTTDATHSLAEAYRKLYGDTRKALSVQQRLRGQVLSLIAAYGGFYGVVRVLGQVIDAYRVLEGVQNRLNAAFQGESKQAADDYDWLRRNADRLGISLAVLGDEYSKYAVAAKAANFSNRSIRDSFMAVAEAGRVNKLSMEQMSGIFLALQQMISKGKITSEELRRQLGDRLPGAFNIMADALGMTTAELDKAMQKGEVFATESNMIKFTEELTKRFGSSLPEALQTMTTALGRMGNAIFMALVQFGEGGFTDAITRLANDITELLKSADFEAFSAKMSTAMSVLVDVLAVMARNFNLVVTAAFAFAGLKLTPMVIAMAYSFMGLGDKIKASAIGMVGFATGSTAAGAAANGAAAGVTRLSVAMRALMSATAIGLAITAMTAAVGYWLSKTDNATEALNEHQKMLDGVRNAYDGVKGSVEEWRKATVDLTISEIEGHQLRMQQALEAKEAAASFMAQGNDSIWTNFFGYNLSAKQEIFNVAKQYKDDVADAFKSFNDGVVDGKKLVSSLDEINAKYKDGSAESKRYAEANIKMARELATTREALDQVNKMLIAKTGSLEDAQAAFDDLGNAVTDAGKSLEDMAEDKAKLFTAAMDEMGKGVAQVKRELDYLEASKALAELGKQALQSIGSLEEVAAVLTRIRAAQDQLDTEYIEGSVSGSLVDRIIGVESGGNANAKNPNSSATGLGQFIESTWLTMFKKYFPDRAAGMTNAAILELRKNADDSKKMVGFYLQENAKHLKSAGVAITDANLYLSHFLGPGGAAKLLRSAPGTMAVDSVGQGAVNANKSILEGKNREQVIAWAQRKVGISKSELDVAESIQKVEEKRLSEAEKAAKKAEEERRKQAEATGKGLADGQFAIDQQKLKNAELNKEAAIQAAIKAAKEANPNITAAELEQVKAQAAALYDLQNAQEGVNKKKKEAADAEERVNQLLSQRNSLQEQLDQAKVDGDLGKQEELKAKMQEINAEMMTAIETAKAMWAAVGGIEADTAIEKLNAAAVSAAAFANQASVSRIEWEKVGDMIVNGLVGAFDMFAQAVANGESVGEAARQAFLKFASDFLIEIGKMIIKQALLNMLKAAFGGTGIGAIIGLAHTGGIIGSSRAGGGNGSRRVDPSMFAGAARYHTGGVVGLQPGEVPIIAKQGEEMLTRDDPRHSLNGGRTQPTATGGGGDTTVVNTFDTESFLEAGLATPAGRKLMMNFVRSNRATIKGVLS